MTKQQVITELTNSGARVYISLWEDPDYPWLDGYYGDLLVNSGEFDACDINAADLAGKYPLEELRDRIMADWPAD